MFFMIIIIHFFAVKAIIFFKKINIFSFFVHFHIISPLFFYMSYRYIA